ncbi:Leucine-rich repeat receptor protein kinase MSP1 [Vitis vinifera]|uniref:Leucine-rich repeat receptor protein kinase MSP1 n=1 Tax=Vitis vinifera TaxID=29760 RepID=A0A438IYY4_VITVI|nr:Leucine-rich repeat receptor protein kinase MSP1 [Vitis vinifera]
MNGVDLHREVHWLESVSMFPSLSELHLSDCELNSNKTSSLGYANFTSLTFLDLSENNFNQEIPNWLFNLSSLVSLSLLDNQFKGQISESLGQLKYLEYLDVSFNSFHGPIPTSIGNLSSLRYLGLSENQLINGTLPMSLWFLSNLENLNVRGTSLTGTISEVHFTALSKLKDLLISGTSLSFHVNSSWTPPFQLEYLEADSCKMGPKFPAWLQTQKSLFCLDVSRSGIVDTAPNWFWKFASYIEQIHLSNNQISGDLSQVVLNNTIIDLSSNCFSGRLPRLSPNVVVLNIANNSFSGQISPFMCQKMNGRSKLEVVDISINALSGELSDCWMHWSSLTHVSLGSNNLSGKIPNSMGSLVGLKALSLQNNSFYGEIPSSLENCKVLGLINLSDNKFSGIIPRWIFERTTLMVIHLRSNKFNGIIPPQICQLSSLIVLDLADNSLSGSIPKCLNNISAMAAGPNYYIGIPEKIGVMASLESLDLSRNHLSGEIPQSMSNLTFLDDLDLSFNNFSGRIPSSTQLQSLDPLSFFGNPELCGAPLTKNCTKDEETLGPTAVEENREFPEISWFYIGMGSGFIVGFWGVCGALFFKRAWRMISKGVYHTHMFQQLQWHGQRALYSIQSGRNLLAGIVSEVHFTKLSNLKYLEMSWTYLTFNVSSNWIPPFQLQYMKMISCKMGPKFPAWLQTQRSLQSLYISNSGIVDAAPSWLWKWASQIPHVLHLSDNQISGDLSEVLLNNTQVDLSSNCFTGQLPHLSQNVIELRIANNPFPRRISSFLCRKVNGGSKLEVLDLSNNSLSGKLSNCLMYWPSLTHLNLGDNNLSGAIPKCINNFSTMARMDTAVDDNFKVLFDYNYLKYEDLSLVVKGRKSEYDSILGLVRTIDFSKKVGSMETLESLDLSRNHLSGAIPESMTNLSFLDHLDLSYNNLSGITPSSSQLQSFDALSFIGNDELCGAPLTKNCTKKEDFQGVNHIEESREDFELPWFYIGMATGFILSFWGVCGALLFKRTWRHAYFRFLDDTRDKLYVATMLKMNWLCNHLRGHHLGTNDLITRLQLLWHSQRSVLKCVVFGIVLTKVHPFGWQSRLSYKSLSHFLQPPGYPQLQGKASSHSVFPCFVFSPQSSQGHVQQTLGLQREGETSPSNEFQISSNYPASRLSLCSDEENCCGWTGVSCHTLLIELLSSTQRSMPPRF